MTISKSGSLASIVKQGDYLVFKAEKLGISVEYSPDAPPENPVLGAFAARNGVVRYLNAGETSKLLADFPTSAEEMLIREIEFGSRYGRAKSTLDKIVDAIQIYADAGYSTTAEGRVWQGRLKDFHREVVEPLSGVQFSEHVLKLYRKVPVLLPGIQLDRGLKRVDISVDWGAVESLK
jgi:hypothetical protein